MRIPITQAELVRLLEEDPDTTHTMLAQHFGCGATSISRHLRKWGLQTKPWNERQHKESTKKKIGGTRKRLGIAKGERNPNYGDKDRPWLEGDNHPLRQWHLENPDFGVNQRGDANPIHKVMHLYDDPEYVEKITRGLMEHVDLRRGSTYEEVYGEEKAAEYKEKLRQASPARMAKFHRKETGPERLTREMLEGLEADFMPQAPLGHYTVDFLVPDIKLVIQADGDYWHAHPDIYGDGEGQKPLSKIQRKRRRLDASCDSYLQNRGYGVLRLWEGDLNSDLSACRETLSQKIQDPI